MKLEDFHYDLPQELIAQQPAQRRDRSRLLVLNKSDGTISHKHFSDIMDFFNEGDLLVRNNSKVFPARLFGHKDLTGGKVEILLNKQLTDNNWEAIGKGLKVGARISFSESALTAVVVHKTEQVYELFFNMGGDKLFLELEKIGSVPLPPYIKRGASELNGTDDRERYQTVYAKTPGSVAAPTAGLHFTEELLLALKNKGVQIAEVTLHVGLGTFAPVKSEIIEEHKMHKESYSISKQTLEQIRSCKERGGRVVAVGTTTTRVLESVFGSNDGSKVFEQDISGNTDIFIYPPYRFKCIDGLITNFHLPQSTLLMLVSAFAGRDNVCHAYDEAIKHGYRFFSYGDAMLIM